MEEKLEKILEQAFDKLEYDKSYAKVSVSNRPELCDFQINSVFKIAKEQGKTPKEIGDTLISEIKNIENINNYLKDIAFVHDML